ncbi:MAG: hypothetical protein GX628_09720 [Clostridiales bacterium]|nr:hypothetical protein [Clostridiales bacterium]
MKDKSTPSQAVSGRLPGYLRVLRGLIGNDIMRVSSSELARLMDSTPSQVRQDLSFFGEFGQKGYGYNVRYLYTGIYSALCLSDSRSAVIIGATPIGEAAASEPVLAKHGVRLIGVFDDDRAGETLGGLTVRPLGELSGCGADIAVICTQGIDARLRKLLADSGFLGIWNLSDSSLTSDELPGQPVIRSLSLGDSLMLLCYEIGRTQSEPKQ